MFRIKICGLTDPEDAQSAVEAGADAIGLNFYARSLRAVSVDRANEIVHEDNIAAQRVGVFVNMPADAVRTVASTLCLKGVQLHGDEPPQWIAELSGYRVIRARRMGDQGIATLAEDLEACRTAGRAPDALLVDAMSPGRYGGTGETVSWTGLANYQSWLGDVPLILAGGLTPENVADAIRTVRPWGVDVASGVESAPGVKDHAKMRCFVEEARQAFASIA